MFGFELQADKGYFVIIHCNLQALKMKDVTDEGDPIYAHKAEALNDVLGRMSEKESRRSHRMVEIPCGEVGGIC